MRYILCLLFFASPVYAQSKVFLHNGSILAGELGIKEIPVSTKFGTMKIPVEDVRDARFGLHFDEGVREQVTAGLRSLSSSAHKDRERAHKSLIELGKYAYPFLTNSSDPEANARIIVIKEKILESTPGADSAVPYDIVRTTEFDVKGNIELQELVIHSKDFGTVKVKASAISRIQFLNRGSGDFDVPANGKWVQTGVEVDADTVIRFSATGSVDLWPQGPGQYVASAKGYNTAGKGGQFMAGALIAKIGRTGQPFFVGDRVELRAPNAGELQLFIVESSWNNTSSGGYKVNVRGE